MVPFPLSWSLWCLLLLSLVPLSSRAQEILPYTFHTLDIPLNFVFQGVPRTDIVRLNDLNLSGALSGTTFAGDAYRVQPGPVVTEIRCPDDQSDNDATTAFAINNVGQVVGTCTAGAPGATRSIAFLQDEDGTFTPLEFPGAVGTIGYALNDQGTVVGQFFNSPFLPTEPGAHRLHGFVYRADGTYTQIDPPDPALYAPLLQSINSAEEVLALAWHQRTGSTEVNDIDSTPAFLLDLATQTWTPLQYPGTVLGTPCCTQTTWPMDINNFGDIVGEAVLPDGTVRMFVVKDGVFYQLGGLPPYFAVPLGTWGLNDAGTLAGTAVFLIPCTEPGEVCRPAPDRQFRTEIHALIGTPAPPAPPPVPPLLDPPVALEFTLPGDFNGDGLVDAVGLDRHHRVWRGLRGGDWMQLPDKMASLFVGDLDENGTDDLAGLDKHGALWVWTDDASGWRPLTGHHAARMARLAERRQLKTAQR